MSDQQAKNGIIVFLLLLLVGGAYYVGTLTSKLDAVSKNNTGSVVNNPAAAPTARNNNREPGEVDPVTDSDHIRGDRNAKIALIEWSDLECPYCATFHTTAQQAVEEYEGELMWVYRHFPLASIHPGATAKAQASECVAKVGGDDAFWAFVDYIFENPTTTVDSLASVAGELGVDSNAVQTCIDSEEMAELVSNQLLSGSKAGVTGTPGNVIMNVETGEALLIPGAIPFVQLQAAIEQLK
ncbi:MAG: DsbA family protein [Patescibacteria group bacterium]